MTATKPRRYEGSPEGFWTRYGVAKGRAKAKGLAFDLDPLEYRALWGQPCHYCGSAIERVGIDRIASGKGYTVENCVPCCWLCNSWKHNLGVEAFTAHVARLYQRLVLNEPGADGYVTPVTAPGRRPAMS